MKNFVRLAIFAVFVGFTACTADREPPVEVENPEVLEERENSETAENPATEPITAGGRAEQVESTRPIEALATPIATIQVPFTVNGTAEFELTAFLSHNQTPHFLLHDIAKMLDGTQAQFDISANAEFAEFRIYRGRNFTADIDTIRAIAPSENEPFVGRVFLEFRWEFQVGTMDFSTSEIGFLETPHGLAFDLESFSRFFGFSVEWQVEVADGTQNRINTYEPAISEEGRFAVSEFLHRRPTLFVDRQDWTDEMLAVTPSINITEERPSYPSHFFLYDFNGNGIPDILVSYDDTLGNGGIIGGFFLYSYINGEYQNIARISGWNSWLEIFRDSEGQIFLFHGNHNIGWDVVQQAFFQENEVIFENIILSPFTISLEDNPEEHAAVMWEWGEFWENFFMRTGGFLTPVSPLDPTVPTTSIRPISALHTELTEYFSEIFNQNFLEMGEFENFTQPQAWQLAYADILRHYQANVPTPAEEISWSFFLHNLDLGGVPELFIVYVATGIWSESIYSFVNGEITPIEGDFFAYLEIFPISENNLHGIITQTYGRTAILALQDGELVTQTILERPFMYQDELIWRLNGVEISENKFSIIMSEIVPQGTERIFPHEISNENIENILFAWRE
ncbi:MAG: hypothetical protein FWG65_02610 [Turicibacter sp.]|nr:hypothetical protein [Turicibacter sp.]